MDPAQLIPYPDALPAPWGVFNVLLVATFTLHLLAANVLVGAGLFALAGDWVGRGKTKEQAPYGGEVASGIPTTLAFTINLGIPPLLFLQVLYGHFIYVSSVLTAVYWLAIFVLIILAYYAAYLYAFQYKRPGGGGRAWFMAVSMGLLLVVGFFFSNSLVVMIDPAVWPTYFGRPGGTLLHLGEPSLIPRYLHFVLSSVAVGGLVMGLLGWWRIRKGAIERGERLSRGLRVYGYATLLQFVVGALYLGTLPNDVLARAAFGNNAVMAVFIVSIGAAVGSIIFSLNEKPWHTAVCALATILLMVVFRFAVRAEYLRAYTTGAAAEVSTQLGPIVMFLVALVVGAAAVVYMVKLTFGARKESRP